MRLSSKSCECLTGGHHDAVASCHDRPATTLARRFAQQHQHERPDAPLLLAPETGRQHAMARSALTWRRWTLAAHGAGHRRRRARRISAAERARHQRTVPRHHDCRRVTVPLNLLSQAPQLAYVLAHSEVRACSSGEQAGTLAAVLPCCRQLPGATPGIAVVNIDVDEPLASHSCRHLPVPPKPRPCTNDPALLMYTSGTTGKPKGALLTHNANLLHAARTVAAWHRLTPADRVLSSLPLYHQRPVHRHAVALRQRRQHRGAAPLLGLGVVGLGRCLATDVDQRGANHHCLSAQCSGRRRCAGTAARPFIRFARSASAPLPPDQHRAFEQRFGIGVIEAMGMTECASVVFCNPQDATNANTARPACPAVCRPAVAVESGEVLPDNATGELQLCGDNVMAGYWNAPTNRRGTYPDGWLRTGDLGHRDSDGFYFVTGRIKELIIRAARTSRRARLTKPC